MPRRPPLSCPTSPPQVGRLAASTVASSCRLWRLAKTETTSDLPPCGGDGRQARGGRLAQTSPSLRRLGKPDRSHRPEFVLVLARNALRPRIDLGVFLAEDEAVVIGLALVRIVHDLALDLGDADALCPFVDALEI